MKTLGLTSPGQLAVMAAMAGKPVLADCKLVVEVWYPAVGDGSLRSGYMTLGHDGRTEVRLSGRAARDAASVVGDFPLVILSHGSPGNCTLLSHFGENLAFKGYVVASIDHFESTCDDPVYLGGQAFGSTLLNRPLDTRFLMDALAATRVAIVGYAMGGYGARVAGGAFVAEAALAMEGGGPWLAQHRTAVADPRLKAIVPIGPWGRQIGVWEAAGMAVPALIIAGSLDDIPGYETGIRKIFDEALGVDRVLLTFEGAGHTAAAPYRAPLESWAAVPELEFVPFGHYADAVWDRRRINNIASHFVTAFLDVHLKGEAVKAHCLTADLAGFAAGSARGLRIETAAAGHGPIAHPTLGQGR